MELCLQRQGGSPWGTPRVQGWAGVPANTKAQSWDSQPAQLHRTRHWISPSTASPRPLPEVFPILLLLQAGTNPQWAAGGAGIAAGSGGAHPPARGETRGRDRLCPGLCPFPVPSLSPPPGPTAWHSPLSAGMSRSSSSSSGSPDHGGTWIQLSAWGGTGRILDPSGHSQAPGHANPPREQRCPTWAGKPCMEWSRATTLARSLPRQVRSFQ